MKEEEGRGRKRWEDYSTVLRDERRKGRKVKGKVCVQYKDGSRMVNVGFRRINRKG